MGERRSIVINKEQIEDVVIAHLYAIGVLNDNEDVIDFKWEEIGDEEIELELDIVLRFSKSFEEEE